MGNEPYESEERARIEARDQVSDEELVTRMLASSDMGGGTLVALSQFVANRVEGPVTAIATSNSSANQAQIKSQCPEDS